MKNIKKTIAVLAAACMSMSAFSAMTFSASAATEIAYSGPSEGALTTNDDGATLRLNLYNIWGNSIEDINPDTVVQDNITVTFSIEGLGETSANVNDDGSEGDAFYAILGGSVAGSAAWSPDEAGNAPVSITGDGTYTVTWDLPNDGERIDCLMIITNINVYNFSETGDTSVFTVNVDSITTGAAGSEGETGGETGGETVDYIGQATIIGQFGAETNSNWGGENQNPNVSVVDIKEDGQYELTWTMTEAMDVGTEGFFLAAQITPGSVDNFTTDTLENLAITLDEVWVDGTQLTDYDASTAVDTAYYEGTAAGTSRIYLRGDWANNDTKIIADSTVVESSIKMVFTVTGLEASAAAGALGDINLDGAVDATDAAQVLIAAAAVGAGGESGLTPELETAADVNVDGAFDATDAAAILQYAAATGSGEFSGTIEEFLAA